MPTGLRTALFVAALATALLPTCAHASGCGDEWTNTAGGSWFVGSNWSNGAPPGAHEAACITADGTYTVAMTQTKATAPIELGSLTLGGATGTQTLTVDSSCSAGAVLGTSEVLDVGAHGALDLSDGASCAGAVTLAGPLANAGTIIARHGAGGARRIDGDLTNRGTLTIETDSSFGGSTLTNEGAIELGEGAVLTASAGESVTNGEGGSIVAAGNGELLVKGDKSPYVPASFTQGLGTISGSKPVVVDFGTLHLAGTQVAHGLGPITLQGKSSFTGMVRNGEQVTIESTCGAMAAVSAIGELLPHSFGDYTLGLSGTLELTSDSCGEFVEATFHSHIRNYGHLVVNNPYAAPIVIESCIDLTNYGVVQLDPTPANSSGRASMELRCRYEQEPKGRLRVELASPTDYGSMVGSGGFQGTLRVDSIPPFVPSPGEVFHITGYEAAESNRQPTYEIEDPTNFTGVYLKPIGRIVLRATQLEESVSPRRGPPGSTVTVTANELETPAIFGMSEIVLVFTDHNGVKTSYPSFLLDEAPGAHEGEFIKQIVLPDDAAPGAGRITITSPFASVRINKPFTVE